MSKNNFLVFAENIAATDTMTDEAYLSDVTRQAGNIVGIARRNPNNKALRQATLVSTAVTGYIASTAAEDETIDDTMTAGELQSALSSHVSTVINTTIDTSTSIVHTSKDEKIDGVKTFTNAPVTTDTPIQDQQLTNKQYVDKQDLTTFEASKQYTDLGLANLRQEGKDYIDNAVNDVLEQAKDYTDKIIDDAGGGSGGTGGAVLAPDAVTPSNGSSDVIITTSFIGSAYRTAYPENLRTTRQFQVTKSSWDECVIDTEVNSDSYTPDAALDTNSDYKWRCRDKSSYGITSSWSKEAHFETGGELQVVNPTITVTGAPNEVPEKPTLTGSPFAVNQGSDTHELTDWRIKRQSDSVVIWSSLNDKVNLESITVPAGILQKSTKYIAEVRYKGLTYNYSNWVSSNVFTTKAQFDMVLKPTLTVTGAPDDTPETPELRTSEFQYYSDSGTPDTHELTDWLIYQGSQLVWQSLNNSTNKTSITVPKGTLKVTTAYKAKARHKGALYGYSEYAEVDFVTRSQFTSIAAPSLTVTGAPDAVIGVPTLKAGSFVINNGDDGVQDTHQMTDWVITDEIGTSEVWASKNDTTNLTSIKVPYGTLKESTKYQFKVRYKGATYGWSSYTTITGTTMDIFGGLIGEPGTQGFGVGPYPGDTSEWDMTPMDGCFDPASDNYGNYYGQDGESVFVCVPAFCYSFTDIASDIKDLSPSAFNIKSFLDFDYDEAKANEAGYILHRAFIDGGKKYKAFFIGKYLVSYGNKIVKYGNPISCTNSSKTTASSKDSIYNPECEGKHYDAVTICKKLGSRTVLESIFAVSAISMLSFCHGLYSKSTTYCAWYDGTDNFPKGCNIESLKDTNDMSVVYTNNDTLFKTKPATGSANFFAKTTHNGQNNGICDINGCAFQTTLGYVGYGNSSYILRETASIYSFTKDNILQIAPDLWEGINLSTHNSTTYYYWGDKNYNMFFTDSYGPYRALCGVWAAKDVSGTNEFGYDESNRFGLDTNYKQALHSPILTAGAPVDGRKAGIFHRLCRANEAATHWKTDNYYISFRVMAYPVELDAIS